MGLTSIIFHVIIGMGKSFFSLIRKIIVNKRPVSRETGGLSLGSWFTEIKERIMKND